MAEIEEMEGDDGPVAVDLPDIRNLSMIINDHTNISTQPNIVSHT